MRQDAVTRDRRYGPLMAKRSEGRKVARTLGLGTEAKAWTSTEDLQTIPGM